MKIAGVHARQIFDSRGVPTVEAEVRLESGIVGRGCAPSGASTGGHEACERRDGGEAYGGKGVLDAVAAVNGEISTRLRGMRVDEQRRMDELLIDLDGTSDKSFLGANATLAVSLAVADAAARSWQMPLYRWLGGVQASALPRPMMNVLNGGAHANNSLDIQEFMFVPVGAVNFAEAMRMGVECYQALKKLLVEAGLPTAVGDEGGFAPNLEGDVQAMSLLVQAIERAGWRPATDVALALDVAASEWWDGQAYVLPKAQERHTREELLAHYRLLASEYPLISIEDPFFEEDFEGFHQITEALGGQMMIVGDDLFTTNTERLTRGIEQKAGNAILIKPNQIGTLTETLDAIHLARRAGYRVILSHRSGDTESTAIADIAVAVNAEFIKSGAPARSERLAKYNRLLRIEDEMRGGRA